jgi:hypothetical protein
MTETSVVKSWHLAPAQRNKFSQCVRTFAQKIFFPALTCLASAQAESLPTPASLDWGPTAYAFSGAAAAMANNQDAFLTNPAGLCYYSQLSVFGGSWQKMPGDQSTWTAGLVDGTHELVGGFHFAWNEIGSLTRNNYTLTTAYRTAYGAVGISIHALRFSGVPAGGGWHFTNSIGVLIPLSDMFTVGIYSKSPYDLESHHDQLPPSIHMAVMYSKTGTLRATFESGRRFRIPDQDWYYAAAGDFLLQDYLAVRGGYRWDHKTERSLWSLGGALIAPKVEITGTFVRATSGPKANGYGFDATFKF